MIDRQQIKEHMEVTDAAGQHVGTVDSVEGEELKLTRSDSPGGTHRTLPLDELDRVEENRIYLKEGAKVPQGA